MNSDDLLKILLSAKVWRQRSGTSLMTSLYQLLGTVETSRWAVSANHIRVYSALTNHISVYFALTNHLHALFFHLTVVNTWGLYLQQIRKRIKWFNFIIFTCIPLISGQHWNSFCYVFVIKRLWWHHILLL